MNPVVDQVDAEEMVNIGFKLRPAQIQYLDKVRAVRQQSGIRSISRSEVIRDALDVGLPILEEQAEAVVA